MYKILKSVRFYTNLRSLSLIDNAKFGVFVDENHDKLPIYSYVTLINLNFIKGKSHFVANSSLCTTNF